MTLSARTFSSVVHGTALSLIIIVCHKASWCTNYKMVDKKLQLKSKDTDLLEAT